MNLKSSPPNTSARAAAVIVAAGRGTRMGTATAKQYLELAGRPILAHVLAAFDAVAEIGRIVLVLPAGDINSCRQRIVTPLGLCTPLTLTAGGSQRRVSVDNGLECLADLDNEAVVLIHDGVRPFIDPALIRHCIRMAAHCGACIPVMPVTETVKQVDGAGVIVASPDRVALRLAQTPQAFTLGVIRHARRAARDTDLDVTDDAALVEAVGGRVETIVGDRFNLKITTAEDLALAQAIFATGLWPPEPR